METPNSERDETQTSDEVPFAGLPLSDGSRRTLNRGWVRYLPGLPLLVLLAAFCWVVIMAMVRERPRPALLPQPAHIPQPVHPSFQYDPYADLSPLLRKSALLPEDIPALIVFIEQPVPPRDPSASPTIKEREKVRALRMVSEALDRKHVCQVIPTLAKVLDSQPGQEEEQNVTAPWDEIRSALDGTLADLSPDVPEVLPVLICELSRPNRRSYPFSALANFGPKAESAVPKLIPFINRYQRPNLRAVIRAFGAIGSGATSAIPDLESVRDELLLKPSDDYDRQLAQEIDRTIQLIRKPNDKSTKTP